MNASDDGYLVFWSSRDQWDCMSACIRHASDPSRWPVWRDNEGGIARKRSGLVVF